MKDFPEHEKLAKVKDQSQAIGEFLEWLTSNKGCLAAPHEHHEDCRDGNGFYTCGYYDGDLAPVYIGTEKLLAEYFEIDLNKLADEKDAILSEIRIATKEKGET